MVPEDMKDATGQRKVVLVTDGEENCGGDVPGAIEALTEAGVDVTLDISYSKCGEPMGRL